MDGFVLFAEIVVPFVKLWVEDIGCCRIFSQFQLFGEQKNQKRHEKKVALP